MTQQLTTTVRSTHKVPNPCGQCGKSMHLKPRWCSDTLNLWIECTACGSISEPQVTRNLDEVVNQWNEENHPNVKAN